MGAMAIVGFFVTLCVCSVFAMIGGLFGALFFRKSAPPPPPPVPTFTPPTFAPPPTRTPPATPPAPPDGSGR